MKSSLKVLGVTMALCLSVGGFLGLPYAIGADITLRYAGDLVIGHHLTAGQEFFAKRVDEISKGRVKVEVYPAGQLFSAKDFPKVVPAGAVDMALCIIPQWSGLVPSTNITELPLFYDDWSHLWRLLDSEAGEVLRKDMEKVGVKPLFWTQDTKGCFATKFPLKTLEDFKGKRIRVPTELASHTLKALGGAPAFMGGGEVYMALQRGTVDGAISSVASFSDRKYYEVTKFITETNFTFAIYGCLMNLKKWNDLPADIQKMMQTAGEETQERGRKEVQKVEVEAMGELRKHGMEVYYLPKVEKEVWRNACKPVYDLVVKKAGDLGPRLFELAEKTR
jgi:tripartite ATP-independent transporter DctP family solute receptor